MASPPWVKGAEPAAIGRLTSEKRARATASLPPPVVLRSRHENSVDVDNAMKRAASLAFTAALLVICGAVKGGDVEDCRNAEALLKADSSRAVSACRRLADQGDALAQFSLGFMYGNGWGVPQDYAEAVKWYHKAAEQEDAKAQYNLGQMYRLGYGVQRDYAEAVRWFRRAANQGDAGAQYNLAFMYETGRGVRQDLVQAYMWFDLAGRSAETPAHQGYAIQYRDSVASKMTPDQIAKAKKLAADWKPSLRGD